MMSKPEQVPIRVLVVFAHHTEIKWLRFLKAGFRHCFLVMDIRGRWLVYNPLSHFTHMDIYDGYDGDRIVQSFRLRGYRVIETWRFADPPVPAPWRFFTCMEAVKRVLAIQMPWILTPWHLYRFLTRHRQRQLAGINIHHIGKI